MFALNTFDPKENICLNDFIENAKEGFHFAI